MDQIELSVVPRPSMIPDAPPNSAGFLRPSMSGPRPQTETEKSWSRMRKRVGEYELGKTTLGRARTALPDLVVRGLSDRSAGAPVVIFKPRPGNPGENGGTS
jgi:hypothetical protein